MTDRNGMKLYVGAKVAVSCGMIATRSDIRRGYGRQGDVPNRLYKYRAFSNLTLDMLVGDNLFFADPSTFNDPLDTRPSLKTDLGVEDLERILRQLVEGRVPAELRAATKTIKYRGPKTVAQIARLTRRHADELIVKIKYDATDPEYEMADPLQFVLGQYVEEE